jgi:hypothetical protein
VGRGWKAGSAPRVGVKLNRSYASVLRRSGSFDVREYERADGG